MDRARNRAVGVVRYGRRPAARAWAAAGLASALALTPVAVAQIALPPVQVPGIPPVDLPVDIDKTLQETTERLDPRQLSNVRVLRVRELLRKNRDVLEADPAGAPILRSEVLAFSPSEAALEKARAAGFAVARERTLEGFDAKIVVLRAPSGTSTRRALKKLRALDPQGSYDFNHVYTESGSLHSLSRLREGAGARASLSRVGASQTGAAAASGPARPAANRVRIGLVDGGVDVTHAVFRDASINSYGCSGRQVTHAHGTAVASLMIGRSDKFHGAAPGAALYAADVYCGVPTGGAVDAVADSLAWLARERVPIINLSLVGPPNGMLERIIRVVIARGHIIVAAVGNDGPSAAPLFPAAYPGVVGVTAVDARQRALVEAVRGQQVDFAAPGADIAAAGNTHSYVAVRGTSFAAPIVAGLLVAEMSEPDGATAERAIAALSRKAIDLGSRGRDTTYGDGLVGDALRIELAASNLVENK